MEKMQSEFRTRDVLLVTILFLALPLCTAAQKQKNSKSNTADQAPSGAPLLQVPLSDELDHDIGEMLGAFQVGDVDAMHKFYADNATFVSGTFAPPVMGWSNYVPIYQRARAQFQSQQLIRRNTFIFHNGDVAWASYQWEFLSQINGQPYSAQGQTTLVFNKVGSNWLIVHNHTSEICPASTPINQQPQRPTSGPYFVPDQH
jgi:ketosteroid isomerase-like protein